MEIKIEESEKNEKKINFKETEIKNYQQLSE